ncbi:hypothetical protein [Desulfonatronum parangueonense]
MLRVLVLMFTVFLFCSPLSVMADDVLDTIEQALTLYKQGDYTAAAGNLDYAAQLVRQKKGGRLESFLPDAQPGWTADDAQSSAMAAMFMGGGVTAERAYHRDDGEGEINISIMADSPMLQGIMMMFSNPMIAASAGAKMETIAGQRAVVNYTPGDRRGEISIVVANRILVVVKGYNVEKDDLTKYVSAMDFQELAKVE